MRPSPSRDRACASAVDSELARLANYVVPLASSLTLPRTSQDHPNTLQNNVEPHCSDWRPHRCRCVPRLLVSLLSSLLPSLFALIFASELTYSFPADRTTDHAANFKPDISTRIADAEQGGAIGNNHHEGDSKPTALGKAGGKLEEVVGKAFGDGELQAKGAASQGKQPSAETQMNRTSEQGGDLSYADRK